MTSPLASNFIQLFLLASIISDAIVNLAGTPALLPVSDLTQVHSTSDILASKMDVACEVSNMILECFMNLGDT